MVRRRFVYGLWLTLLAILWFFENNAGTRAALLISILLPLLSVLAARFASRRARAVLVCPETLRKGEEVPCVLRLSASLSWLYGTHAKLRCCNGLTGEAADLSLHGTGMQAAAILSSECCGLLHLEAGTALTDWLGLCRFQVAGVKAAEACVQPELLPVRLGAEGQERLTADGLSAAVPRPNGGEGELRDYIPGDPPARIHWKLSAKADRLLTRQEEAWPAENILLLLETARRNASPAEVSRTAEGLLSLSWTLVSESLPHTVLWPEKGSMRRLSVSEAADWEALRAALLRAETTVDGPGACRLAADTYPELSGARVFVFSPTPETDAVSLAQSNAVTLILPGEASSGAVRTIHLGDELDLEEALSWQD